MQDREVLNQCCKVRIGHTPKMTKYPYK